MISVTARQTQTNPVYGSYFADPFVWKFQGVPSGCLTSDGLAFYCAIAACDLGDGFIEATLAAVITIDS